jgi:magnesium transporter
MPKLMRRRSKMVGLPPGTLIHLGEQRVETPTISVIDYNEGEVHERVVATPADCRQYFKKDSVTWINVVGLHNTDLLQQMGDVFNIHPLVLEDIGNTGHRPKLEDHDDFLFMIIKMIYRRPDSGEIVSEQVSVILGGNYVLSFQEIEGDVFGIVRDRIRTAKGRIRQKACDYLAYSLLDAIVDNYFGVLEDLGDQIEDVQEKVLQRVDPHLLHNIHRLKREAVFMRKNLWPLREMLGELEKTESDLVDDTLGPYLRDVYEHTIQVIDNVELLRDMLSGSLDTYMTMVSNRMNEVMKVLTIIATVFIPLTFIAGIYGMNFEHMPELKWPFGYGAVWLVMIVVAAGMAFYFKRKKWL